MNVTVNSNENFLTRGMDPKPLILDYCKPHCHYWQAKLDRCEKKLEIIVKTNPTKSCMYPMRDLVTCIEACVSERIECNYWCRHNLRFTTNLWELSADMQIHCEDDRENNGLQMGRKGCYKNENCQISFCIMSPCFYH